MLNQELLDAITCGLSSLCRDGANSRAQCAVITWSVAIRPWSIWRHSSRWISTTVRSACSIVMWVRNDDGGGGLLRHDLIRLGERHVTFVCVDLNAILFVT